MLLAVPARKFFNFRDATSPVLQKIFHNGAYATTRVSEAVSLAGWRAKAAHGGVMLPELADRDRPRGTADMQFPRAERTRPAEPQKSGRGSP